MVSVVINFAENIEKFLNHDLTTSQILLDYYTHFIPWINGLLWPLFALVAVIFFTSRMARDAEIIAILNAGVSFNRILRPYLIASFFIAGLMWIGNNYIIPRSNKIKNEFESEFLSKNKASTRSSNVHFYISPDTKIFIRYYRSRDTSAQNFRIERFDSTRQLCYLLKANRLEMKTAPNIWTIKDYSVRHINGLNEEVIINQGQSLDTMLNFTPEDFTEYAKQMEDMASPELVNHIKKEEARGLDSGKKYKIELYRRTADPFTIVILTIIGLAVASRKVRGGMGLHLAIGVVIGATYVLLSKLSLTFATNLSFSPLLGTWTPNIVFGLIAGILVKFAQK